MKLNKKHLPFYAAIVQTIQYAFGGFLYFSWVGIFIVGSMGALISFSTAFAASQIDTVAKGRKTSSWFAFAGIMLLSPVIIGTSIFYGLEVIENPIWRGIVAAVWGVLPDGATALAGFISGKSLVADSKQKKSRQPKTAKISKQNKSKMAQSAICPHCKKDGTLGAINAHKGKCKKNPANQFAEMAKVEK